jgi:tetratricopeptide (TPR) repeat protein
MKSLPLHDQRHLDAAEGWLGLGDPLAATEELDQISPGWRGHPLVLEVTYRIFAETKQWESSVPIARIMVRLLPDHPWGHFHLAFALHELKRTREAYDTLVPVADIFPTEWLMRFNLACYACQLGHLPEALRWLKQAMSVAGRENVRRLALADQDLQPLWPAIREL